MDYYLKTDLNFPSLPSIKTLEEVQKTVANLDIDGVATILDIDGVATIKNKKILIYSLSENPLSMIPVAMKADYKKECSLGPSRVIYKENSEGRIMEPTMGIKVILPGTEARLGEIVGDLHSRGGRNLQLDGVEVTGVLPLSKLIGYKEDLRSMTQNRASYSLAFAGWRNLSEEMEELVRGAKNFTPGPKTQNWKFRKEVD